MKTSILTLVLVFFCVFQSKGQLYSAKKSEITFFSSAPIEDIAATNTKAQSIFNTATNEIVFSIPIDAFEFEKDLMKEHFNEKYLESEDFPKATFKGVVKGFDMNQSELQKAQAKGVLKIHGVEKKVVFKGTLENNNGTLNLNSKFQVKLVDYNIEIPQLLWKNIAEEIEVTINITYKEHAK